MNITGINPCNWFSYKQDCAKNFIPLTRPRRRQASARKIKNNHDSLLKFHDSGVSPPLSKYM